MCYFCRSWSPSAVPVPPLLSDSILAKQTSDVDIQSNAIQENGNPPASAASSGGGSGGDDQRKRGAAKSDGRDNRDGDSITDGSLQGMVYNPAAIINDQPSTIPDY